MPTTLPPPLNKPHTNTQTQQSRQTKRNPTQGLSIIVGSYSSLLHTSMGMQSNEGTVMFSSIALLQQRFRELERIKEKREERLLQMLVPRSSVAAASAAPREAPVKWFFHPELLYPCRPLRDTAATLFPVMPATAACECKTFQLHGDTLAVDLWPSKAYKHVSSEVDVDTSLHL